MVLQALYVGIVKKMYVLNAIRANIRRCCEVLLKVNAKVETDDLNDEVCIFILGI